MRVIFIDAALTHNQQCRLNPNYLAQLYHHNRLVIHGAITREGGYHLYSPHPTGGSLLCCHSVLHHVSTAGQWPCFDSWHLSPQVLHSHTHPSSVEVLSGSKDAMYGRLHVERERFPC